MGAVATGIKDMRMDSDLKYIVGAAGAALVLIVGKFCPQWFRWLKEKMKLANRHELSVRELNLQEKSFDMEEIKALRESNLEAMRHVNVFQESLRIAVEDQGRLMVRVGQLEVLEAACQEKLRKHEAVVVANTKRIETVEKKVNGGGKGRRR